MSFSETYIRFAKSSENRGQFSIPFNRFNLVAEFLYFPIHKPNVIKKATPKPGIAFLNRRRLFRSRFRFFTAFLYDLVIRVDNFANGSANVAIGGIVHLHHGTEIHHQLVVNQVNHLFFNGGGAGKKPPSLFPLRKQCVPVQNQSGSFAGQ